MGRGFHLDWSGYNSSNNIAIEVHDIAVLRMRKNQLLELCLRNDGLCNIGSRRLSLDMEGLWNYSVVMRCQPWSRVHDILVSRSGLLWPAAARSMTLRVPRVDLRHAP